MINKTKIITTLGPATDNLWSLNQTNFQIENVETFLNNIENVLKFGSNIFRFNMSHGNFENHIFRAKVLRDFFSKGLVSAALMFDTKGPEIRVSKIQTNNLDKNIIFKNNEIIIYSNKIDFIGDAKAFSVYDSTNKYNLAKDLKPKNIIYIEDGKLVLEVISIDEAQGIIKAKSLTNEYVIKENRRLNIRNGKYSMPFLSEYDKKTIQLACDLEIEFLALSFVRHKKDLNAVKALIKHHMPESEIKIISKIETQEALDNIDEIVKNSDGIMIARGDLALDVGFEKIAYYQQIISKICRKYKKPFIVATQMLDSLERNLLPTRAEVTDVFFAIENEADSTMLSGESAQGNNPLNAIGVMQEILHFNEQSIIKNKFPSKYPQEYNDQYLLLRHQILNEKKKIIVTENYDFEFLLFLSNLRLNVPIIVLSDEPRLFNKLLINYGLSFLSREQFKAQKISKKEVVLI